MSETLGRRVTTDVAIYARLSQEDLAARPGELTGTERQIAGVIRGVTVALLLGMIAALVPATVLLVRHGSKARKMAIPFAPFLALGSVIALFVGDELVHAYLTFV